MDAQAIQKLKADLLAEKKEIEKELGIIASENPLVKGDFEVKVDDVGESMEDAAQELGELDRNQAMVEELQKKLKHIDQAIHKLDTGAYGVCDSCASPIEEQRLKVVPVAALCVACAQQQK